MPQVSAAIGTQVGEAAKKFDLAVPLTLFVGVGAMSTGTFCCIYFLIQKYLLFDDWRAGVAIATFFHGFLQLGFLMPLGVLGICTGISAPSVAVAWLKSRRRHLGPILEASG